MIHKLNNIFALGVKELRGLLSDTLMMALIIYSFTIAVYTAANSQPETINQAAVAIVDEDGSQLSMKIRDAFFPPMFKIPEIISRQQINENLDKGKVTFVIVIPPKYQRDCLAGMQPSIQVNVDATRISQAFTGSGYIHQIIIMETQKFLARNRREQLQPVRAVLRNKFNPNLTQAWYAAINDLVSHITMLAIILTGTAIIKEREHGTLEHLLVMPVTPFEIMISKIWSMSLVVLIATFISVVFIIKGALEIPVSGSVALFMCGVFLHLFAITNMGIFLATVASNMPQLGMLTILILMPMEILSGGSTPLESMPDAIQKIMSFAPTTHFIKFSETILYRGAGIEVVWKQFLAIFLIGLVYFAVALARFRKTVAS